MKLWKSLAAIAASFVIAGSTLAQNYPNRPLKVIVPFAPGGSTDIIGRIAADHLQRELGQPVVVENRAGAAGAVGTVDVKNAEPDGYTLLIATVSTMIVYPAARTKPDYTLADFAPITNIASMPNIVSVSPKFPAKDLKEFIEVLKKNPGKYTFASSGVGSINHMLGESFQSYAGVKLVHIPYKGSGPGMTDVMAGQVDMIFDQFPSTKTFVDAGKLKGIGIISPKRVPGYDIMTMEEAGLKGFTDEAWYGLLAPAKTPPAVVAKLTETMKKIEANPQFRAQIEKIGARPVGNTSQEFAAQIKTEIDHMKKVVQERNIKLDD
ncbi:MAG TPA: tripartite tricarboxylate transporter substrate binding protein [Usitatibacter sp.]|nr:tripartite tricarboxylate transporter substrate binding protein [Usitatibacter sp.]